MPQVNRCPPCGTPPHLPHLRNCKAARYPGGPIWDKPTVKMIDLANRLLAELDMTGQEDPENMTFQRCQALIDRLIAMKEERGEDSMKSTGIVRKVDELGRVVIPIELRRTLDIEEKDGLEIYVDNDRIILRKYQPACIFCGNADEVTQHMGKNVCKECAATVGKGA